jgi:hypothetical protein
VAGQPPQFPGRYDGHVNTLTVFLDTNGNIFGGFTPVEWESRVCKGDGRNCFTFSVVKLASGIPDFEQHTATLRVAAAHLLCAADVQLDAEGFVGGDIAAFYRLSIEFNRQ